MLSRFLGFIISTGLILKKPPRKLVLGKVEGDWFTIGFSWSEWVCSIESIGSDRSIEILKLWEKLTIWEDGDQSSAQGWKIWYREILEWANDVCEKFAAFSICFSHSIACKVSLLSDWNITLHYFESSGSGCWESLHQISKPRRELKFYRGDDNKFFIVKRARNWQMGVYLSILRIPFFYQWDVER